MPKWQPLKTKLFILSITTQKELVSQADEGSFISSTASDTSIFASD